MAVPEQRKCFKRLALYLSVLSIIPLLLSEASAQSGIASIYSYKSGRTASGEQAHPAGFTAAHRSLPLGTRVHVTNRSNGRSVVVRINDRGPFVRADHRHYAGRGACSRFLWADASQPLSRSLAPHFHRRVVVVA